MNLNPVIAREAKQRFRSGRASFAITAWVGLLGALAYLLYVLAQQIAQSSFGIGRLAATAFMGRFMFHSVTLLLLTAIIMVVPGIAAPSIVGERERQTFQLLQVTQMSPWQLVIGKLAASMAFALVLVIAVAPVAAIPLLFGGVRIDDVLAALGMLLLTAVMLAAVATWASSRARSTRGAVALAYLLAFSIAFLSFVGLGVEMIFYSQFFENDPFTGGGHEVVSILPNPYFGLVSAVQEPLDGIAMNESTPFAPLEWMLYLRQGAQDFQFVDAAEAAPFDRVPVWVFTVIIYIGITVAAIARSAINVRAPSARIRMPKRFKASDA